ncbi:MAG: hypothetical protein ACI9D0_001617 [Bacteroidia bacterium]|jgi:hypothetical protein
MSFPKPLLGRFLPAQLQGACLALALALLSAPAPAQGLGPRLEAIFDGSDASHSAPEIHGASTRVSLAVLFLGAMILTSKRRVQRAENQ